MNKPILVASACIDELTYQDAGRLHTVILLSFYFLSKVLDRLKLQQSRFTEQWLSTPVRNLFAFGSH